MTCRTRISFFATKSNRCPSRSDREILDDDVVEDDLGALVSALPPRCAGQGGGASGDARGWFAPSPRGVPGAGGSGERGSGSVRRSRNASYSSDLSGCVSDEEGMCDVLREVGARRRHTRRSLLLLLLLLRRAVTAARCCCCCYTRFDVWLSDVVRRWPGTCCV